MARWTLTDYSTGSGVTYTFAINPNTFVPPGRNSTIKQSMSTSPQGSAILFQGRDGIQKMKFSGRVTTQTFHDELRAELDKYYVLELADDQSNLYDIVIESYSMTRVRSAINQWRFDYEVTAIVVA